jgi:sterol desaturase/sphingolipid hydroxylase (fatty acid hydroxylase superfamily)
MDKLFGTYTCPPKEPDRFGIKEDFPRNYIGQMLKPMLPKFICKRINRKIFN